ncbi:putative 3-mercaptopyruvate sulfurtransferase [Candidatus Methylobacter favarea]|uniref:Putative 3-mercaptopyruvate sulfurtransferase n=1 Tax=Candidatus Methylobacter favarea TaxID=2707345 RepID=A0A8S0WKD4_9GAMM|nr:sulfurtransferase [Candidatus Methylobacter favarea]CAA9891888.1 putative 3-mercaptopyruvate sulfurtransferase [Candidatus Methylobacter favarea]
MSYNTLVSADILHQQLDNPNWIIVDCRFSLTDSEAGAKAYRRGHIPHARYVRLDKDLSSKITAHTGRHPLPDFTVLTRKFGDWGIENHCQVIVYDNAAGAFAGRLWWLLRCLGHDNVAVLEGGIQQWLKQGYKITTSLPKIKPAIFKPYLHNESWLNALQVQNNLARKSICLIDARSPERYRGEQELIDPVAGHIPGALNRPFQLNLDARGLFLPPSTLNKQFNRLLGDEAPEYVVHMCGSGVTACHNILAMEHAGLKGSKLYAGSWSEWIRNKNRAVFRPST